MLPGVDGVAEQLVRLADADGDGALSWRETELLASYFEPQLATLPNDRAGDGAVDREDVKRWLRDQGGLLATALTSQAFNIFESVTDSDGDGVISVEREKKPLVDDIINKAHNPTDRPDAEE